MNAEIVDERDVSIEEPLPIFRITVWASDRASAATYDITDATVTDVLEFARSPSFDDAASIEIFCKFVTSDGERGTILLDRIDR